MIHRNTGFVHPDKFWKNYGAQTGDKLILTKPLGAGIINTAIKADLVSERAREAVLKSMKTLNKYACEILKKYTIHACTDSVLAVMEQKWQLAATRRL